MTIKPILIASLMTFSLLNIASAKSYSFSLTSVTMAGSTQLKPGDYEVKVSGTQAIFTNEAGKSFTVPVTIGQSDKKFDSTTVDTTQKDNKDSIREIDLGGSTTRLQFQ